MGIWLETLSRKLSLRYSRVAFASSYGNDFLIKTALFAKGTPKRSHIVIYYDSFYHIITFFFNRSFLFFFNSFKFCGLIYIIIASSHIFSPYIRIYTIILCSFYIEVKTLTVVIFYYLNKHSQSASLLAHELSRFVTCQWKFLYYTH